MIGLLYLKRQNSLQSQWLLFLTTNAGGPIQAKTSATWQTRSNSEKIF